MNQDATLDPTFLIQDLRVTTTQANATTPLKKGKILELKRVLVDNVLFEGFSIGLKLLSDVLIQDTVRIHNSDLGGARNELDTSPGKVRLEK